MAERRGPTTLEISQGPGCGSLHVRCREPPGTYCSSTLDAPPRAALSFPLLAAGFRSPLMRPGPLQQSFRGPGVHDRLGRHAAVRRPRTAVGLPLQLAWCVGVAVDGDLAADVDHLTEQALGRIEALGPAVDLDRLVEGGGGAE